MWSWFTQVRPNDSPWGLAIFSPTVPPHKFSRMVEGTSKGFRSFVKQGASTMFHYEASTFLVGWVLRLCTYHSMQVHRDMAATQGNSMSWTPITLSSILGWTFKMSISTAASRNSSATSKMLTRLWGCIGLRMRTSENLALVCQHRALFACGRPHGVSDCRKFAWGHHLSAMSSLFVLGTSRQILSLLQTLLPDRVLWRFVRSTYSVERQKAKTLGLESKVALLNPVCWYRALIACGPPHGMGDCRKFAWKHHPSSMSSLFVMPICPLGWQKGLLRFPLVFAADASTVWCRCASLTCWEGNEPFMYWLNSGNSGPFAFVSE